MYNSPVLVLNQNFVPVNVCSARRGVTLVISGKAEVLEWGSVVLRSPSVSIECPSVVRLVDLVRLPSRRVPLTRREVFLRDGYTCQYCGRKARDLTLDHVVPRSRGGPDTWENLVSACGTCNSRKGSKSLEQARMRLITKPREPRANPYKLIYRHIHTGPRAEWLPYLPGN